MLANTLGLKTRPTTMPSWALVWLYLILSAAPAGANNAMNEQTQSDSPVHTVYFQFGEDSVSVPEQRRLGQITNMLESTSRPVVVQGFTDSIGFQAYNDDLALRRAHAVRQALLTLGIPGSRIETAGVGRAGYVADNRKESTRHLNRRVEIRLAERRLKAVDTFPRRRDGDAPVSRLVDPRRVGRYSELTAVPSPGQANPLQTLISVTFPSQIQTVGAALNHVLARSGWALAPNAASDPTLPRLMRLPLPESQRSLGPIALMDALGVLCGEAYSVVVDPIHRLVSCELRARYADLVQLGSQSVPDDDMPAGKH